jgi:hypothetical protein
MNRRKPDELIDEPVDAELEQWLAEWQSPEIPARLDAEVRATYRRAFPQLLWWQRWLMGSLRVPVPVAAAAVIALCVAVWLAIRPMADLVPPLVRDVPQLRFVAVPIVQEKLVTRVLYAKPKSGLEKRAAQSSSALPAKVNTTQADLAGFRPVSEIRLEIDQGGQER